MSCDLTKGPAQSLYLDPTICWFLVAFSVSKEVITYCCAVFVATCTLQGLVGFRKHYLVGCSGAKGGLT